MRGIYKQMRDKADESDSENLPTWHHPCSFTSHYQAMNANQDPDVFQENSGKRHQAHPVEAGQGQDGGAGINLGLVPCAENGVWKSAAGTGSRVPV